MTCRDVVAVMELERKSGEIMIMTLTIVGELKIRPYEDMLYSQIENRYYSIGISYSFSSQIVYPIS